MYVGGVPLDSEMQENGGGDERWEKTAKGRCDGKGEGRRKKKQVNGMRRVRGKPGKRKKRNLKLVGEEFRGKEREVGRWATGGRAGSA